MLRLVKIGVLQGRTAHADARRGDARHCAQRRTHARNTPPLAFFESVCLWPVVMDCKDHGTGVVVAACAGVPQSKHQAHARGGWLGGARNGRRLRCDLRCLFPCLSFLLPLLSSRPEIPRCMLGFALTAARAKPTNNASALRRSLVGRRCNGNCCWVVIEETSQSHTHTNKSIIINSSRQQRRQR